MNTTEYKTVELKFVDFLKAKITLSEAEAQKCIFRNGGQRWQKYKAHIESEGGMLVPFEEYPNPERAVGILATLRKEEGGYTIDFGDKGFKNMGIQPGDTLQFKYHHGSSGFHYNVIKKPADPAAASGSRAGAGSSR